jgi:putative flippase GtrA
MSFQFLKYGFVAATGYILLISVTYFFIEIIKLPSSLSYFLVITSIYIANFFANTNFVFSKNINKNRMIKYIIALFFFWLLNNSFFNILVKLLDIQYLIAIITNIVIFGLLRFFILRRFVFN